MIRMAATVLFGCTVVAATTMGPARAAARAARGAQTVRLIRQVPPEDLAMAQYAIGVQLQRRANPPKGLKSANALVGKLPVGDPAVTIAIDESQGTGKGFDVIVVDANRNGDLSDDRRYEFVGSEAARRLFGGGDPKGAQRVELMAPAARNKRSYRVNIAAYVYSATAAYAQVVTDTVAIGLLRLGGQRIPIVVVDANVNGTFGDRPVLTELADGAKKGIRPGDRLLLDLNGDGRFGSSGRWFLVGKEEQVFCEWMRIGGRYYEVTVRDDGAMATFAPVDPPMGTLRIPQGKVNGLLLGMRAAVDLSEAVKGRIQAPAGTYYIYYYSYSFRGPKGKTARIDAYAFGSPSKPVRVVQGKPTELALAQPLTPKVSVRKQGSNAYFVFDLAGPHGERIGDVRINGRRPAAPSFVVYDAKGKQVLADKFHYG